MNNVGENTPSRKDRCFFSKGFGIIILGAPLLPGHYFTHAQEAWKMIILKKNLRLKGHTNKVESYSPFLDVIGFFSSPFRKKSTCLT